MVVVAVGLPLASKAKSGGRGALEKVPADRGSRGHLSVLVERKEAAAVTPVIHALPRVARVVEVLVKALRPLQVLRSASSVVEAPVKAVSVFQ